jgi:hypothetical protein
MMYDTGFAALVKVHTIRLCYSTDIRPRYPSFIANSIQIPEDVPRVDQYAREMRSHLVTDVGNRAQHEPVVSATGRCV